MVSVRVVLTPVVTHSAFLISLADRVVPQIQTATKDIAVLSTAVAVGLFVYLKSLRTNVLTQQLRKSKASQVEDLIRLSVPLSLVQLKLCASVRSTNNISLDIVINFGL